MTRPQRKAENVDCMETWGRGELHGYLKEEQSREEEGQVQGPGVGQCGQSRVHAGSIPGVEAEVMWGQVTRTCGTLHRTWLLDWEIPDGFKQRSRPREKGRNGKAG